MKKPVVILIASLIVNMAFGVNMYVTERYIKVIEPKAIACTSYTKACDDALKDAITCYDDRKRINKILSQFRGT